MLFIPVKRIDTIHFVLGKKKFSPYPFPCPLLPFCFRQRLAYQSGSHTPAGAGFWNTPCFFFPRKPPPSYFDFRWSWAASCPPIGTRHSANTLFIVLCVTVGIAPQTLFYCLCVQLPLFPFYEQWKICRVLFRGTSSPALCQYVRLHSRYIFLTGTFKRITHARSMMCFPTISQRLLGQVRTSYRCIKPVLTSQIEILEYCSFTTKHRISQ